MALNRKIAYIDLTSGDVKTASIPIEMRQNYIGGRGLDIYLLFNHLKKSVDALSPENAVIVSAGFLDGMLAPAAGWTHIMSKSALTGYLGSANLGEFFGPELRWAGFDHLVIAGKSAKPVYIYIHDGKIKIQDAGSIWGKSTRDTQKILVQELDEEEIQTLCIGPAGEKLVRFAGIISRYQNAGGRTGIGAVWGSKNLKAIVAKGTMDIEIKFPKEALEYDKQTVKRMCATKYGQTLQIRGTRFANETIPGLANVTGVETATIDEHSFGMDACFGCQFHCRNRFVAGEGADAMTYVQSPGYRNQGVWETELTSDINTILTTSTLVNDYGLDPVETGNLISWAIKLYEKGILTDKDTAGLKLEYDNTSAAVALLSQIGNRQGLGDVLAEGVLRASQKIGGDSANYISQIKGISQIEADAMTPGIALSLATSTSASDHTLSRPAPDLYQLTESELKNIYSKPHPYNGKISTNQKDYEGKSWQVFWQELCYMAADMTGICKLHTVFLSPEMPAFEDFSKMLYLNTGLKLSPEEIWECANRAYTLERLFNLREGYAGKDDSLPERYFAESGFTGNTLDTKEFKKMVQEYYKVHQWDDNGIPQPETLKKLGLDKEPGHQL